MIQPPQTLLLDACCLLNLYATGYLREIASSLPVEFGVADYVATIEMLFIRKPGETGEEEPLEPVDIQPFINDDVLQVFHLEHSDEKTKFLDLAVAMDDGEAETGAIAFHRGFAVASDDRKARNVLGMVAPSVRLVSTLELLKEWSVASGISDSKLQKAFHMMETRASFIPGKRDSLFSWWKSVLGR